MIRKVILILAGLHLSFGARACGLGYSFSEPADSPCNKEADAEMRASTDRINAEREQFLKERTPIVVNDGRRMEVYMPQGYGMYQRLGTD